MSTTITSYKDLQEEKARLKALAAQQKLQIKTDWDVIKEDIRPSLTLATTIKAGLTRKASGVAANLGINLLADGLVKNVLMAKSGGISRWLIPFLLKNFASHVVGEPGSFLNKVTGIIKNKFGKKGEASTPDGTPVHNEPVNKVTPQEAGMDAV
jgi:hypothetical protein